MPRAPLIWTKNDIQHRIVRTSGCWLWNRSLDSKGYGQINMRGRVHRAHRVAYTLYVGPIPKGFHLHHRCGNRRCVNPYHLKALSQNNHNGLHLRTHCRRGHEFTPENTYTHRRPTGRVSRECRTCALNRRYAA